MWETFMVQPLGAVTAFKVEYSIAESAPIYCISLQKWLKIEI